MEEETVKQTKTEKYPNRWKKGQSGNPAGRPRKPEVDLLREALEKARSAYGKDFIVHFVQRAYRNDAVAIALARKLLPDFEKLEMETTERKPDFLAEVDEIIGRSS